MPCTCEECLSSPQDIERMAFDAWVAAYELALQDPTSPEAISASQPVFTSFHKDAP